MLGGLPSRRQTATTLLPKPQDDRPFVHPLADVYRRKVSDLHNALLQADTRAEAAEILRGLIDEIKLTPESGALRVDLKGALASILRLAAGSREPVVEADRLEQIKVVAGVGFEPTTFRL